MPVTEKKAKTVSFTPELIDPREEEEIIRQAREARLQQEQDQQAGAGAGVGTGNEDTEQPTNQETSIIRRRESSQTTNEQQQIEDGTGRRFRIPFQEHRLRFDQTFPKGLDMRIPPSEFEIVLEQIHRDFVKPLDKGQKSVKNWSIATAGTAPIGVGFILSIFLARRVNRHQKALKKFWISLRSHLKILNRDIYYARGIEWRIERDMEKVADRDAYNKLHSFRIEIIFRKPIVMRSGREIALRSIVDPTPTTNSRNSTTSNNSRFSDSHLADPELFALLSTGPNGENYTYPNINENEDGFNNNPVATIYEEAEEESVTVDGEDNRTVYSSPFLIPDHVADESNEVEEPLLIKVPECSDVAEARRTLSTFEPPSPNPTASVYSVDKDEVGTTTKKMTFADLLRMGMEEDERETETETSNVAVGAAAAGVAAVGVAAGLALESGETDTNGTIPSPTDSARSSREEAFAKRQRKKFTRSDTLATQFYAIPESPTLPTKDADPTGDAMNFLNAPEGQGDDMIEDMLGGVGIGGQQQSDRFEFEEIKPVRVSKFEDIGNAPVAAYPKADPFAALYETEETAPLDPISSDSETEYAEVDGETEYVRCKKWRVAPERADKLSRVQTMTESIHPASRRNSYLPVTKTVLIPDTIDFKTTQE